MKTTKVNALDKDKLVLFDARLMNLFIDVKRVGLGCPSDYGFSNVCYKKAIDEEGVYCAYCLDDEKCAVCFARAVGAVGVISEAN